MSPVRGALKELDGTLGRGRDDGGESKPRDVERRGERLHLEVADRDDTALVDEHERVRLGGVQLDRELGADEAEGVAGGAVLLGDRPEGERVLKIARLHLTAVEQRSQARERRLRARVRPRLTDRRMDRVPVGAERFEVERSRVIEDVEEHERIRERERAVRRRERALVEQRDCLTRRELEPVQDPVRQVGHLRQVALADRSQRSELRQPAVVQGRDEMRCKLGSRDRRGPREGVREPECSRSDDLGGHRRPL